MAAAPPVFPQVAADEFYRNFNGVAYNSLEPETCHLVYVSRVDMVNESEDARLPIPGTATGQGEVPTATYGGRALGGRGLVWGFQYIQSVCQ